MFNVWYYAFVKYTMSSENNLDLTPIYMKAKKKNNNKWMLY